MFVSGYDLALEAGLQERDDSLNETVAKLASK